MAQKDKPSYEAKLDRAYTHFKAFDDRWAEFLKTDPYDSPTDEYTYPDDPSIRMVVIHQVRRANMVIPHQTLALILGDALYNLRSALDHLAGSIGRNHCGSNFDPSACSFPIHGAEASFSSKQGQVAYSQWPDAAKIAVKKLQPWHANTPSDPDAYKSHPLFLLNALGNEDKHRTFVFDGAIGTKSTATLDPKSRNVRAAISQDSEVRFGAFDDKTDVIRLYVRILHPDHHVEVNQYIHINPAFPKGGIAEGKVVMDVCSKIVRHIREVVIPELEHWLPA